jgi:hypothetical protein
LPTIPADDNLTLYSTEIPLGVLIANSKLNNVFSIQFQAPIFFWVSGSIGHDTSKSPVTSSDIFHLTVVNVVVKFYYNDIVVNSIYMNTENASFIYAATGDFSLISLENPSQPRFYGLQYMGMLRVNLLSFQSGDISTTNTGNDLPNNIFKINVLINSSER